MFSDPPAGWAGTLIDPQTGTIEHFLGNCDASHIASFPEKVLAMLPGWVDIATNGAHVVYCWAQLAG